MSEQNAIARLAAACAARIDRSSSSFDEARPTLEHEMSQLLDAVKTLHPRYAFDRAGRPAAVTAVRGALPLMERDLFDAVLEDCQCELAATREALFQVIVHLAGP